jgi:hypothetical protein
MKPRLLHFLVVGAAAITGGCVTTTLAPGAAQVRIVHEASDVTGCTAVGNVVPDRQVQNDVRNVTVGLGGNTLFVTAETLGGFASGVAYRCP